MSASLAQRSSERAISPEPVSTNSPEEALFLEERRTWDRRMDYGRLGGT
jgi:hypothetical protein